MFNLIANAAAAAPAAAHDAGMSLMPASMCVKEEGQNPYGLVPALCEGGIVSQVTFLVLLIMFVGTLYILFTKLFEQNKVIGQGKAVDANFWRAPTPDLSKAGTPRGNPGRWATNDDYPARAMREEREGTAGFRVTYNVEGRVTSCDITSSSGHADLDAETCKLITRRGRFNPGKDRAGNPTGGTYSNRIRWQIPR